MTIGRHHLDEVIQTFVHSFIQQTCVKGLGCAD